VDHVDSQGELVAWDPEVLIWLVDTIEELGPFLPTDWNHRTRIEITATKGKEWFAHFLTGGKDLLDMTFRLPRGTLTQKSLDAKLKIKTLDERGDLPIYGTYRRLRVRDIDQDWQQVRMSVRDFDDVRKPAFRAFLKSAAKAYFARLESDAPQAGKQWKTNGRDWHLTQKAMIGRQVPRWNSATLMTLIGRFAAIQRDIVIDWNHQTAVQLRVPGEEKPAGKIVTNMGDAIRVELRTPPGLFTPAMVDKLGLEPEIKRRTEYDSVIFRLRKLDQTDQRQLADVWHRCRAAGNDERLRSA